MTTTDDSKSAVADKLSLSEKVVKKAKEEFNPNKDAGDSFESLRKDILEWLSRVGRPKNMGGYSNEFIATSIISDFYGEYVKLRNKYFKDVQPLLEEIERLKKNSNGIIQDKSDRCQEYKERIADLEEQLRVMDNDRQRINQLYIELGKENQELVKSRNGWKESRERLDIMYDDSEKENQELKIKLNLSESFISLLTEGSFDDYYIYCKEYREDAINSLRKSGEKASPLVIKPNGEHSSGSQEGDKLYCSECGVMAEDCVCSLRESGEEDE